MKNEVTVIPSWRTLSAVHVCKFHEIKVIKLFNSLLLSLSLFLSHYQSIKPTGFVESVYQSQFFVSHTLVCKNANHVERIRSPTISAVVSPFTQGQRSIPKIQRNSHPKRKSKMASNQLSQIPLKGISQAQSESAVLVEVVLGVQSSTRHLVLVLSHLQTQVPPAFLQTSAVASVHCGGGSFGIGLTYARILVANSIMPVVKTSNRQLAFKPRMSGIRSHAGKRSSSERLPIVPFWHWGSSLVQQFGPPAVTVHWHASPKQ